MHLLQKDPDYLYLDVRSVPEFEQGHPIKAINIPLLNLVTGMGMLPNDDFVAVLEANLPKDAKLLVGCKTGGRSFRACEILSQRGYSNIVNVRTGFVGVMDNFGRIVEPGWGLLNLPVCTSCEQESRYDALFGKAKK